MAETKILNLDAFIAEQPDRIVHWQNQDHPVVGMTGEAYLQFLHKRKALDDAQKKGDEAAQWEQNIAIIGILTPSLAAQRDALLKLKLPALTKLTAFIMAEMQEQAEEQPGAGQPGELTSP